MKIQDAISQLNLVQSEVAKCKTWLVGKKSQLHLPIDNAITRIRDDLARLNSVPGTFTVPMENLQVRDAIHAGAIASKGQTETLRRDNIVLAVKSQIAFVLKADFTYVWAQIYVFGPFDSTDADKWYVDGWSKKIDFSAFVFEDGSDAMNFRLAFPKNI